MPAAGLWRPRRFLESLPAGARGSYVLLLALPRAKTVAVGGLGEIRFAAGCYAYAGSAMGGLRARLGVHLKQHARRHWHIDYLLAEADVLGIEVLETGSRKECAIARALGDRLEVVPRFGASDCRCLGHLFFAAGERRLKESVAGAMAAVGS